MDSLNYLREILRTLKPEELKSLKAFLELGGISMGSQLLKSIDLIGLTLDQKNYTAPELQKVLYGKINYQAFNKLVNRLKDKTLEVLLLNINLKRGYYSERSKTIFELRKKLIQVELLILKGVRLKIISELNLIIEKAKVLEVYDVLVQALYAKQRFQVLDVGATKAELISKQIQDAELKWTSLNYSQSKFNELISMISSSSNSESYRSDLTSGLNLLKVEYDKTNSPTIGYYYKLLMVEKFQNEKNYKRAAEFLVELNFLIENNKSVYSKYRLGTTTLNIANNLIFLKKLDDSFDKLVMAKEYFVNQPANLAILNEIEFYTMFYRGNIDESRLCLEALIKYTRTVNTPILLDKRIFFKGCIEFIRGEFKEALELMLQCHELDKDKEGWNIIKRIMITLCRIELEDYESVDLKINSLDKFIKRLLKTRNIKPRYLIIIRVLRKLINDNFDYTKVFASRTKYFNQLTSEDPEYRWEIKSPELVIFDEWFKSKMKKKAYDHKAIMQHIFV